MSGVKKGNLLSLGLSNVKVFTSMLGIRNSKNVGSSLCWRIDPGFFSRGSDLDPGKLYPDPQPWFSPIWCILQLLYVQEVVTL